MIEATSCGGVVIFRGKILVLYKNYKNNDFFADFEENAYDFLYWTYMEEQFEKIATNEENKKGISLKTVTACFYF